MNTSLPAFRRLIICGLVLTIGFPELGHSSPYQLRHEPERVRSKFWMPLASFVLPGLDQFWEGQYGYGAAYSGLALFGVGYAGYHYEGAQRYRDEHPEADTFDLHDENMRRVLWGGQLYQTAGGFSAYHAYRSAIQPRRARGQYRFMPYDETPGELALAPFRFGYLKRPTTFVPLAIGAVVFGLALSMDLGEQYQRVPLTSSSVFYSGALSYNAGTHEEAIFRGWIMPEFMELTGSEFTSNALSSLLFAAAHLNTVSVPVVQLLLGWHFGHVTQKDNWRISEAIFIHTWWDVFAFLTLFQIHKKESEVSASLPPAMLPALNIVW